MRHRTLNRLTMFVLIVGLASQANAQLQFRGLTLYQQGNELPSPALNRPIPFAIDVQDNFNRAGMIAGTDVDGLQIGFVPPYANVPVGPLNGNAATVHGRWAPQTNSDYVSANGRVHRQTNSARGVMSLPWLVETGLGDDYLVQMSANVAEGEEVRVAYFGDAQIHGTSQGLDNALGQLVLAVQRGSDFDNDPETSSTTLTWVVSWDVEGNRQIVSSTTSAPVNEELNLQLGWRDENLDQNGDRFDAWLGSSSGNIRLAQGNMGTNLQPGIHVHGVGFEILGTNSTIDSFTSAVPEPTTGLGLSALLAALGFQIRRRQVV